MSGRWRQSFAAHLGAGMVLVHLVLAPVLIGGVVLEARRNYVDGFVDLVRSDAYLLASTVRALPLPATRALLEDAALTGRVVGAELSGGDGAPALRVGALPDTFREDFAYGTGGDGLYLIEVPLGEEMRLRLAYDERPTAERIGRAWTRALVLAAAYVVLTLLVAMLSARRMARPLRELRAISRHIAAGHVDRRLGVDSPLADVRDLAGDLERMRARLVSQAEQLEHLALHDTLTGLANRTLLEDRLRQAVRSSPREGRPFALLLIDLDGFKEINDTLGHQAGDALLRQVGMRLRESLRESDTIARLGGDEFAVLLPGVDAARAPVVARKVTEAIDRPCRVGDATLQVRASVGIALFPDHGRSAEELLRCADVAMYAAKRAGAGFALYDPRDDAHSVQQLVLTAELREAVERGGITVAYQPQVDPRTGRVEGLEALARWRHGTYGEIPPDRFIPAAERSGLITPLTLQILETALRDVARWREAGHPVRVSVNLSPYSLRNPECVERLAGLLERARAPRALVLELTENAVFADVAHGLSVLERFHELGLELSIDDFGSGYSSLAYLRRLPIREIKIAHTFVSRLHESPPDEAVVRGVLALAHSLGLRVVAEGVEDRATLERLAGLGCDLVQGFHIARPMPAEDVPAWLAARG